METIYRLKDSIVGYLSPKRRRTIGPTVSTPANSKEFDHPFHSDPQDKRTRRTLDPASLAAYTARSRNPRKRLREEDDFETDGSELKPDDSASQCNSFARKAGVEGDYEGDGDYEQPDEEEDVEEDAITESDEVEEEELDSEAEEQEEEAEDPNASLDARVEEYLARQAELALRKESIEKARKAGDWHTDALFLFERLTLRSFEPLIPQTWKIDFPTLPEILFTEDDDDAFVGYNRKPSGHGVKALQALLSLGVRVRDKITVGLPTEKLIEQEINRYIKWSERDGGFDKMRFLPVLSVVRARPKQSGDSISLDISTKMNFFAKKYRDYFGVSSDEGRDDQNDASTRAPPLLYGIIVAKTLAIFVTLDSTDLNAKVRHMQHFDFKDKDMDVWNGFALAIMIICARNYIMSLEGELEIDDTPVIDEDA
ncbi:uncharacterized protein BP5553_04289 [Venustampulla echinocandica]|uniref:Uncharacterized protein n=1 Tax=Venustampulla echinocandica TaxID=2656787 RepID=A0A370TWQ5_9HELO|nr:uncharacterized protein BP5553_04289 [Venustampulla echinocandica]RDL39949.1 hypothetical protein BP5553_04289 [Venustampulla echinocandica]